MSVKQALQTIKCTSQLKAVEAEAIRTKPLTETEQATLDNTEQLTEASKACTKLLLMTDDAE